MTSRRPRHGLAGSRVDRRPYYARVLRLRHIRPGWVLCFLFFEGAIALAALLALAELVDWPAVIVLPASIAIMTKFNDVIAGAGVAEVSQPRSRRGGLRGILDASGRARHRRTYRYDQTSMPGSRHANATGHR